MFACPRCGVNLAVDADVLERRQASGEAMLRCSSCGVPSPIWEWLGRPEPVAVEEQPLAEEELIEAPQPVVVEPARPVEQMVAQEPFVSPEVELIEAPPLEEEPEPELQPEEPTPHPADVAASVRDLGDVLARDTAAMGRPTLPGEESTKTEGE